MIELLNVKKVYTSKKHADCVAIKNLSFTLPDVGMVFVLGKSGCGKSTLLNLLGGLDDVTEGKIIVGGNDFSSLSTRDGDSYRCSYAGFVFQDFCLLEGMTVAENVRISLDLLGRADTGEVLRSLNDVGLSEYADRYPCELSGGQCQRVAIARALVKSPKLILADEPTGNLDSKTAKQVLGILKRLSEERLVVIVSHNSDDAAQYGDRIIELSDGEVIRDVERSREAEEPLIGDGVITLPREAVLSESDIEAINRRVAQGSVRITQAKDPFVGTTQPVASNVVERIERPSKMRAAASLKLSSMLAGGGHLSSAVTSVILTVLALILCFAQAFSFFDSAPLIRDAISRTDTKSFTMHKGYRSDNPIETSLKIDKPIPIQEADLNAFYGAGYTGEIYLLYTTNLMFDNVDGDSPIETGELADTTVSYTSPYTSYGNGVLATDERFLAELYGKDGEISLLCGEINDNTKERGVFISDYAADCIIHYNENYLNASNPYEAVIERYVSRTNIMGVFETGYKERYSDLFTVYREISETSDDGKRREAIEEMVSSDQFSDFVNEVDKYLGIG